jgi:hypothetical protein
MAEFRYQGVTQAGRPVQGTIFAPNRFDAKHKINEIAKEYGVRMQALQKRVPFFYKVRKANQPVQKGEVLAFTPQEVRIC